MNDKHSLISSSLKKYAFNHIHSSEAAVKSLNSSPVLIVPDGSIIITLHLFSAKGLCSTPLGTTNNSPVFKVTTFPSLTLQN